MLPTTKLEVRSPAQRSVATAPASTYGLFRARITVFVPLSVITGGIVSFTSTIRVAEMTVPEFVAV